MTDSMNFGPEWLRNLSSEGTTTGLAGSGMRCQLADYRYGREEMLALFERGLTAPPSLSTFAPLFSEAALLPLALLPVTEDDRQWVGRGSVSLGISSRGRGTPGSGERGGRVSRGVGRGGTYQPYNRTLGGYEGTIGGGGSWGTPGEPTDWSPRKDFAYTRNSTAAIGIDNWRRNRSMEDEDGWRNSGGHGRPHSMIADKWSRSASWREGDEETGREKQRWHDPPPSSTIRSMHSTRRSWDLQQDDHLPEWATTESLEGGGTFDASGAFHGTDDDDGKAKMKELQKSASQHNIRNQRTPTVTASKSAISLASNNLPSRKNERDAAKPNEDDVQVNGPEVTSSSSENATDASPTIEEAPVAAAATSKEPPADEEDFDRLQEDFVSKLVVDEEPAKSAPPAVAAAAPPALPMPNGMPAPPPNLLQPQLVQEKWFYQDPQGDLQGPFLSSEMADWYKAGYFTPTLFVRRQCDDRFYTLGELVASCSGNPFLVTMPLAPLKPDMPEAELNSLHFQQAQQQQFLHAQLMRARGFDQVEPWTNLPGFQRTLFAPQGLMPTQMAMPQPPPPPPAAADLLPPGGNVNPLLHHVLNQFKISGMQPPPPPPPPALHIAALDEPNAASIQLDPLRALVQQMGGLQTMPACMPPMSMAAQSGRKIKASSMTMNGINSVKHENDGLMKHFIQQQASMANAPPLVVDQRIDLDSLWKHPQFQKQQQQQPPPPPPPAPPSTPQSVSSAVASTQSNPQWPQSDLPISMWDAKAMESVFGMQQSSGTQTTSKTTNAKPSVEPKNAAEKKSKRGASCEESKKQADSEEKAAAKADADEKRKSEQKKLDEKRKKDEERIRKELEKARKEAEEKRQREALEKKRLKEQRKQEEEAKRKAAEEAKKQLEEERLLDQQLKEQQQQQQQVHALNLKPAKAAPWCQATNNQGLSFAEIQKLERERKAEHQLQQQQQQLQQKKAQQSGVVPTEQCSPEKINAGLQLNWANKPLRMNHVKSFAEIQAEEQDRILKQKEKEKAAQKEKELTVSPPVSTIWRGQSLTWSNSDCASAALGLWDEPPHCQLPPTRLPNAQQQLVQAKSQSKQKQGSTTKQQSLSRNTESANCNSNNNSNNSNSTTSSSNEFTNWCVKTLDSMNTKVDIPTFISFLRDIESALDVRDYCREYLGDRPATQQFAAQFLEKRRSFKPKHPAYKDDMCSPAPAITPSMQQHNSDFQEVRGKGKKCKKSKMLKVDARILGFNVTAAQDRINVGDRDYGET